MDLTNCWDFKKCGREPGGEKAEALGVCPAATMTKLHGMNGGINGGRICWFVPNTTCNDSVQSTVAAKFDMCLTCDFYQHLQDR